MMTILMMITKFVVEVSSATGKFFGSMSILSSHEDSEAWSEIYGFIHSLNVHPKFRMSASAQAITKVPQLKHLSTLDKNVGKCLFSDIEEIQWSSNN